MNDIRLWTQLRDANIHGLLRKAAHVFDNRSLMHGATKHQATGAVDSIGAIAMASGARFDSLAESYCQMIIPRTKAAGFVAAIYFVESSPDVEGDLLNWNDDPKRTKQDVINLFNNLADELENTI